MEYYRFFPRYDVSRLKAQILFEGINSKELNLKDVGIGGLQIRSKNKIVTNGPIEIKISLATNETYQLNIIQVWHEEDKELFMSGFKFYFSKNNEFKKWQTLMKALHLLRQKNQSKK